MMADNEEGVDSIERDFDSFIICYVSIAMIFRTDASQEMLSLFTQRNAEMQSVSKKSGSVNQFTTFLGAIYEIISESSEQ